MSETAVRRVSMDSGNLASKSLSFSAPYLALAVKRETADVLHQKTLTPFLVRKDAVATVVDDVSHAAWEEATPVAVPPEAVRTDTLESVHVVEEVRSVVCTRSDMSM